MPEKVYDHQAIKIKKNNNLIVLHCNGKQKILERIVFGQRIMQFIHVQSYEKKSNNLKKSQIYEKTSPIL